MQGTQQQTLNNVVYEYSKLKTSSNLRKTWTELSEKQLWEELCICILSSNVPYELALSAFYHLHENRFLDVDRIMADPCLSRKIKSELSRRIYEPKRRDGTFRKYRFPNVRASDIAKAAITLYRENSGLYGLLRNFRSEKEARSFLASNVSGVGLKEASHFLRNIGYSESLAIVDTHVISFLVDIGELSDKVTTVTPAVYMKIEKILVDLCGNLGLNISFFDKAIWKYMRRKDH
jgi:N-glycosylase/DNA lyase